VVDDQQGCGAAETASDVNGDLVGESWHKDHHSERGAVRQRCAGDRGGREVEAVTEVGVGA
jgi:hypothetical protein